jgi:hypothetical protein
MASVQKMEVDEATTTSNIPTYDINSRAQFSSLPDPSKLKPPDQYPRPALRPPRPNVPQAERHAATADLGNLETLPVEVLDQCLAAMDLAALRSFRLVNRRGLELLDDLKAVATVFRLVPDTVNAVVRMGLDSLFEIDNVLVALFNSDCATCGSFGRLFNLTTSRRTCYRCLVINQAPTPPQFRIKLEKDRRAIVPLLPSANLIYTRLARTTVPYAFCVFLAKKNAIFATLNPVTYEPVLGWIAPHVYYWDPRIPDFSVDDTLRVAVTLPFVMDKKAGSVNWGFTCGKCLAESAEPLVMENDGTLDMGLQHVCEEEERWVRWYGVLPET